MNIALFVLGSPYGSAAHRSALRYATAAINSGHQIYRVFFYHEAVSIGNQLTTPPQDENNLTESWATLAKTHQIELVVCIASALKRGILDATEAERYQHRVHNLHPSFELSGLGQLVDASLNADRVVSFGP